MKSAAKHVLIEVARYLLALTFLFSGVVKAIDPVGAGIKVGEYFTSFQMPFMTSFAMPVAIALSTLEFMLVVGRGKSGERLWLFWGCF